MPIASELPVDTSATAMEMADAMFGNGITIVSATYVGAEGASGIYTDGDAVSSEITPSDSGVILSTGMATDITNSSGDVNVAHNTSTEHGTAGNELLTDIAGIQTYDAALFEAEFIPYGDTMTMQFVFSSEEYLEYVNQGFNDAVGVWVNGVKADLTIGNGEVSIDNINDGTNSHLYVDNASTADTYNTEMDGFTMTLTLTAPVNAGEVNTLFIGIADAGDAIYDSNLLIAGDSIETAIMAEDDTISIVEGQSDTLDVLSNDHHAPGTTLTVTHINGQPVVAGSTVALTTGELVTLNVDGTFSITAQDDVSSIQTSSFTYTVEDELGNTDTGEVSVSTIACFVAGTHIETVDGPVPVEDLEPGMKVITRDRGAQPLRWIGQSRRRAEGDMAPIRFEAGAIGRHQDIELSPCHRVLIDASLAELLFGTSQVLVKAKHLVNGNSIKVRADGRPVHYFHLLFDQHEIILANGMESESYHPGTETASSFDPETRAEFLDLMEGDFSGYGQAARLSLRAHEARLLTATAPV